MNYTEIIDRLAVARNKQQRTLQEIADELSINKTTLFYWESHKSKPRFDQFLNWVEALRLDIKQVIHGK